MSARYRSIDDMPPGMRKLFEAQYVQEAEAKMQQNATPQIPNLKPYRPMNVGADEGALANLNKTETRYLEILRSRPELIWIGVHVFQFRIAANTHYTPDFATLDKDGIMSMIDAKGAYTYEDAQLKMKVVARMFPFFRWVKAELRLSTAKRTESLKETVFKG